MMLFATAACATPYAYSFQLTNDGAGHASSAGGREVLEDADVRAELLVDPTGQRAILIDVANRTDQLLQVQWAGVTMTRSDGLMTTPRPDVDVGWIEPGKKQVVRLIPFILPPSGSAARAVEGQRFDLEVPMIVRREPKRYRYAFSVHLQEL
jgi:hypothetical protein